MSGADREVVVGSFYRPGWRHLARPVPFVQLSGEWLVDAGFAPGDEVRVVVEYGRVQMVRRDLDLAAFGEAEPEG